MRRFLITIALIVTLLLGGTLALFGCEPVVAPGAEPSSLIPTRDETYDIGRSNREWRDIYVSRNLITNNGTMRFTFPVTGNTTFVGTDLTQTLTSKTLTSPSIGGTVTGNAIYSSVNMTTPTIYGTPVVSNRATGSGTLPIDGTAVMITHGMAGTPTVIFLTYTMDAGDGGVLYWHTANTTYFTAATANASSSDNITFNWLALIADE